MADEAPDPISRDLREAFEEAIVKYEGWRRGEPEPDVSFKTQEHSIRRICLLVSEFEDPMPDDLWHLLASRTGGEDLPNDRSYRCAAQFLARLITERKAQHDRPRPG
jgi:hypothetical protein